MLRRHRHPRNPRSGQALVVFALALVGMLAMVGLIIDGGNAFAQQRQTQNGIDAAAEAGAVQLVRRQVGLAGTEAEWDTRVNTAVTATAAANGITSLATSEYTDLAGSILGPVGTGTIPANAVGVHARGDRNFATFVAGVIGLNAFTATAEATAVSGPTISTALGAVIPLTFPVILTQCESGGGSTRLYHPFGNAEWPTGPNNMVALPLCNNGPGNIGWIDWTPPNGGVPEIADFILGNQLSPQITAPKWHYITETGGNTSLDAAMDTLEGTEILIPIYDAHADDPATSAVDESLLGTCDAEPDEPKTSINNCPIADIGFNGQGWYFLVTFGKFQLEHSYIQGNHQTECNDPSLASAASPTTSGNPINNCLIGYFKERVIAGNVTVGGGPPTSTLTPYGVQLIK
jgi:Flp pilus assembly protein TadG